MGIVLWTVFIGAFGAFLYFSRKQFAKNKKTGIRILPGPKGLPIVGNLHQFGPISNKAFSRWTEQYGDIYQVQLGQNNVVVVSDPKMTKEMFSNDLAFTGKPILAGIEIDREIPGLGVFLSEGEIWETHRRFLLRQIRDFGYGKSSMEPLIMEEVKEVISCFRKQVGQPIGDLIKTLRVAVVNPLLEITISKRFPHDDPKVLSLAHDTVEAFNEVFVKSSILVYLPWIRHLLPNWSGYSGVREMFDENRIFFDEIVRERLANFKAGGEINDYVDVFLNEMKNKEGASSTFSGGIGVKQLVTELFDLFNAGNNTTATTLAWALLYLCKFPEVQKRLQKEVEKVAGGRQVSVTDRGSMPYAMALVDEVLRFSSINQTGIQHVSRADREFHGYFIPKGSILQPNLRHIHFNKRIWGDPENFRPERFLTEEGKYKKSENLLAFQVGKRVCFGESLARDSIFLYLTNLLQVFSMKLDPEMEEGHDLDIIPGFLNIPKPFTLIMEDRAKI